MSSGKLFLLAGLFALASVVIGAGVGGYVAYRGVERSLDLPEGGLGEALSTLADLPGALQEIAGGEGSEFAERTAELRARYPFTPPADGRLTDAQVERFLGVKRRLAEVDAALLADAERLESAGGGEPDLAFLAEHNFFTRLSRLRGVQAEALAEQAMSLEEFRWVHLEIYKASMARGAGESLQPGSWSAGVEETVAASKEQVRQALADPSLPAAQRQQLEQLAASLDERGEALAVLGEAAREQLAAVPPENFAVLDRHQQDLARYLFAAVDLDTIDFMAAMDAAGLMPQ